MTTTTRALRAILEPAHGIATGLVVVAAVVALTSPAPAARPQCQPHPVDDTLPGAGTAAADVPTLLRQGWTSDPRDRIEATCAPGCHR